MARKGGSRTIYLPWERRGGISRRLGLARARPFAIGLAILAVLVLVGMRERQRTGERATRAALLVVRRAVDAYRADHDGKCPKQLEEVEISGHLANLPDDAWGRPFRFQCPSRKEGVPYDLSSDGPDGEPSGLDRIQ